jgi:hypothetical protein
VSTRVLFSGFTFVAILLAAAAVSAETPRPQTFGDYTVHYNAFTSDTLQPSVAEAYNITRSKNRGMFTVTVMKKSAETNGAPVRAHIVASASNLTGQFREFDVREINEGNTVYYISVFHVAHEEMLDFNLQIQPEGATQSFTLKFRQQFYTQ